MKILVFIFVIFFSFSSQSFACDKGREFIFEPVLAIQEITVPEKVQRFIGVHAFVNPQPVFIKKSSDNMYAPLNGVLFKNVHSKKAKEVIEFSKTSKSFSTLSVFFANSFDEYQDIFVSSNVTLDEVCSVLELNKEIGADCRWSSIK